MVYREPGTVPIRPCPRCAHPLERRALADVLLDECSSCGGLFLERAVIEAIIAEPDHSRADALIKTLPSARASSVVRPGERMYIKCPVCGTVMNRKLFASGAGVIIDTCKQHGTFFDSGELPAVITFVMNGGLAKQPAAPRPTASPAPTSSVSSAYAADAGSALVDLLIWLVR